MKEQVAKLKGRNSYQKPIRMHFMRMKEDHMLNGQLKAGYNIQIGTENRFVLGYSVHQRPGDPGCFIPHMQETQKQRNGLQPKNVITDSAYGSEENYLFLEKEQIQAYLKYGSFHKRRKVHPKSIPLPSNICHLMKLKILILAEWGETGYTTINRPDR
jgi:hypothetical protein